MRLFGGVPANPGLDGPACWTLVSGDFAWGSTDGDRHQSNAQPHFPDGPNAGTFFPGTPTNGEPNVGVLKSSPFTIAAEQLCWQASGFGSSFRLRASSRPGPPA